jgi:hypothetical protein
MSNPRAMSNLIPAKRQLPSSTFTPFCVNTALSMIILIKKYVLNVQKASIVLMMDMCKYYVQEDGYAKKKVEKCQVLSQKVAS